MGRRVFTAILPDVSLPPYLLLSAALIEGNKISLACEFNTSVERVLSFQVLKSSEVDGMRFQITSELSLL